MNIFFLKITIFLKDKQLIIKYLYFLFSVLETTFVKNAKNNVFIRIFVKMIWQ